MSGEYPDASPFWKGALPLSGENVNPISLTPAPLLGLALYLGFQSHVPQAVAWVCLAQLSAFIFLSNHNNRDLE